MRSTYTYQLHNNFVIIDDQDRGKSVTNDIENVIHDIEHENPETDLSGYRWVYRDTQGIWDEVLVLEGMFMGWKPLNERDLTKIVGRPPKVLQIVGVVDRALAAVIMEKNLKRVNPDFNFIRGSEIGEAFIDAMIEFAGEMKGRK